MSDPDWTKLVECLQAACKELHGLSDYKPRMPAFTPAVDGLQKNLKAFLASVEAERRASRRIP